MNFTAFLASNTLHRLALPLICILLALVDVPSAVLLVVSILVVVRLQTSFRAESGDSTISPVILASCLLFAVALPVFMASMQLFSNVFDGFAQVNGGGNLELSAFVWVLMIGGLVLAARWPGTDAKYVWVVLIFFAAIKFYYVEIIDANAVSDFRSMLVQADRWVEHGLPKQEYTSVVAAVHGERILLYLYPIRLIFGTDYNNYQYVNVVTSCLTALLSFVVTKRLFGRLAARVALVIALYAIEPLQAAEIPTHDIPGALALMGFVFAGVLLSQRFHQNDAWYWSILLGTCVLWVSMQRSIGVVLILSLLIYALFKVTDQFLGTDELRVRAKAAGRIITLILFLPCLVYWTISSALGIADLQRPAAASTDWRTVIVSAHSESWGGGTYGEWRKNWLQRKLPDGGEKQFVIKRLLSDYYYNPAENIAHYFRKAKRLFAFGGMQGFYLNGAVLRGEEKVTQRWRLKFIHINKSFAAPVMLMFMMGIAVFLLKMRRIDAACFPLLVFGVFCGTMLLFSEVQSRYLFSIWYIAPIYIGYLFSQTSKVARDVNSVASQS